MNSNVSMEVILELDTRLRRFFAEWELRNMSCKRANIYVGWRGRVINRGKDVFQLERGRRFCSQLRTKPGGFWGLGSEGQ